MEWEVIPCVGTVQTGKARVPSIERRTDGAGIEVHTTYMSSSVNSTIVY